MQQALAAVEAALSATEARCAAFRSQFDKYAHLWRGDLQAALRAFLAAGGAEAPSLDAFASEIARYKSIQDEVQAAPATAPIGWLKVDARPLKQALLTWTSKWTYLYMRHLHGQARGAGVGCWEEEAGCGLMT